MPPALALLSTLANRSLDAATNISIPSLAANSTIHDGGLHVICAWPVSGQYGPGTRVLYYALVAASVFARKADWLRGASLAGALIIPAVAALHGIILAIMHVPGAVDMDIYGAFQACCIGILAAPITVKLSKTYFNDPGRNTIFLWTILLLAGLLSLTVEFYRVSPTICDNLLDQDGNAVLDPKKFPYQDGNICGLTCSVNDGPFSPMRTGAVNNIYVIPVPGTPLTTGTATLIAAACCIPAILLLISMWNTILENNWRARFGWKEEDRLDDIIEGTNAATLRKMRIVNKRIGSFLGIVEALVFGGAVLAILIIGEINFFSPQTYYQTEPIASIGQWGALVGAALAALGSLYVWSMRDPEPTKGDSPSPDNVQHCSCIHHHHDGSISSPGSGEISGVHDGVSESTMHEQLVFPDLEPAMSPPQTEGIRKISTLPPSTYSPRAHGTKERAATFSGERGRSPARSPASDERPQKQNTGGRLKIAGKLEWLSEKFGTAEKGLFDDSDFRSGEASYYPSVPGEQFRNPDLHETEERYQATRDLEENKRRSRSRAPSIISNIDDGGTSRSRAVSPSPSFSRRRRSSTLNYHSSNHRGSMGSPTFPRIPERSLTLTVPGQIPHHGHTRQRSSLGSGVPPFTNLSEAGIIDQSPISPISPVTPAIVVSPDPETITGIDELAESPDTAGPVNSTSSHSPA